MQAQHLIYHSAGNPVVENCEKAQFHCWLCGFESESGVPKTLVLRDTFMDIDKARAPESSHLCAACTWCFAEQDETLSKKVGSFWLTETAALAANSARIEKWHKAKNKNAAAQPTLAELGIDAVWGGYAVPQKMRTYSHFVVNGEWRPLTKAQKGLMRDLLFNPPQGEWLAVIADTGQKHIVFRAQTACGNRAGIVQFEEQRITYEPVHLHETWSVMNALYEMGFTKEEIATGNYSRVRLAKIEVSSWRKLETAIKPKRGAQIFDLALFLVQKIKEETEE